ncbi:MAG: YARHG domain-containing protein [Christensenellaceae bacterium]|nr:YARHG domain-containing protein [Christensenellaceae bacterium]
MKKKFLLLLIVFCFIFNANIAFAARQYIIPDSDSRYLSREELLEWDYESIGFLFNEIFARHGYNFIPGEVYDVYFRSRPWYTPNANPNNTEACYPLLNKIEWYNEKLCKDVRKEMRDSKWTNPNGKNFRDYVEWGFDVLMGFNYTSFPANLKFDVYSAPNVNSYRGAKGKAKVSTNGAVYVAGEENGWLLCMYETNNGSVRVGYINGANVYAPSLNFFYENATIINDTFLTDDPAKSNTTIINLRTGDNVTYLNTYMNRKSWAYVETYMPNGQTVRGFVPLEHVNISLNEYNGVELFEDN